ncbi:brefeldin a-inhibited guanine nucleotide-exchange [Plasmopara halstedii]|uniref:Brefeldin a-inhibited guanine nucleotide-exchange n=1 Tax=Plasmopara halstedii TaxID=4781 RepID=A0A0P1AA79_PLAHL|nr:brefeldin a-inhibited guanine nucleotide-exchange [Plasmopara halstedii]CEG37490.1 brefeldin a-inhibited guanine nucleotide-exchange [Plasmopara halstedii]|eukprot:XP_024573859.1 brefeldin a-inhibited guanine nucleotide-exchange [Plasmopara halstedii]
MEALVLKSLSKLRKTCTRSHRELRDMVDAAQAKAIAASQNDTLEVPFEPFLLACLTRHAKLVAVALDCMEKFLAFGFLKEAGAFPEGVRRRLVQKAAASSASSGRRSGFALGLGSGSGSGTAPPGSVPTPTFGLSTPLGSNRDVSGEDDANEDNYRLIDCIVEVACDCNDHSDEGVQIQVLRVLLTAVTTPTCEVHEHALLRAVRACYHVHLVSKSATNRTVAKATLQQIISIVFQRMETFDRRVEEETISTLHALEKQESEPQSQVEENQLVGQVHDLSESDSDDETLLKTLRAERTAAWYPSVAILFRSTTARHDKQSEASMARKNTSAETLAQPANTPAFPSVLHKDAFLLFRSLCRISMRSVADDGANASPTGIAGNAANSEDPFAFQSKILSLDLLKEIVENAGPSFRRGERFVHAIRQYLCQSLLQNCTSNYTQIVSMSLQVFLVLLRNFKRHLKTELDIFITSIFLRLLQSENASFEHKLLVLEALHAICDDPQTLGEIFINYDCDWNTNDLFKQIVHALAKAAKGSRSQDPAAQQYAASLSSSARVKMLQQDAALALKGLECLTATTASLKKAANCVEVERQSSQQEGEESHTNEIGNEEDIVAPPDLLPVVSSTMSAVEAFESKRKRQEEMATGILKFNVKPSAGIAYLVAHGHMGEGSPRDVAQFLHSSSDKLDKTMVGDYLGNGVHYQGGFCVKVLHEYVDMMDFTGLEIDIAIRHFLAGFRLPGESQKIDRMMEKFAERFFNACPPGLFPSADTAFILAFSIIMLQTDLHNPSIAEEKKMDKAGFLRNNRGINDGKDLPEDYMGAIFDRIKATPISLKEDDDFRNRRGVTVPSASSSLFGASNAATDRMRRDAYIKERESMVRQSEALFKRRIPASSRTQHHSPMTSRGPRLSGASDGSSRAYPTQRSEGVSSLLTPDPISSTFHEVSGANERSHVRPMFDTLWAPLLAACSVTFESSESAEAIQLCLDSFRHAVHLSARLGMPAERDAFVTVLAKFTALHTTNSRLMRSKNMEAIKALISISVKEGNYLGDSWHDVLQAISQLARIQTHAQGLHERLGAGSFHGESSYFNRQPSPGMTGHLSSRNSSTSSASSFSVLGSAASSKRGNMLSSPSPSHRELSGRNSGSELDEAHGAAIEDENAARVLSEIDQLASDRVFSSSVSLSDQALQDFVLQLTVVSLSECSGVGPSGTAGGSPPRVFSLQKLVEVADMNMRTRSRMVWAATWQTLSRHFTTIGCHEDLTVGMYAIDSLRQLSMKFLERAELRDFNFQRLFLAPFEVIMANATSLETRELVLRCVENLVLARVGNIRSGWKTIWGVLRVAAETYAPGSEDRVVLLGFQVARGVLERHFDCIVDVFVDAVECLLAFAVCGCEEVERQSEERLTLTKLGVDSAGLIRNVCIEKLATGEVIEPLFARETVGSLSITAPVTAAAAAAAAKQAARVGFKKVKVSAEDPIADGNTAAGVQSPSKRTSVRYQKQESVRSLEEEVAELSPRKEGASAFSFISPRRRADSVETQEEEQEVSGAVYNDSAVHTRMWWPVLTALSTLAADRRLDVRLAALDAMFDALEKHGNKFSSGLWGLIFKGVLIPLLDELRHLEVVVDKGTLRQPKLPILSRIDTSRMPPYTAGKTTATLCLERLLECFGLFYDIVGFLPEVLFLLGKCMDAGDAEEQLAIASARALEVVLVKHGHKFPEDVWGMIADELRNVMKRAEPTWIFFAIPHEDDKVTVANLASPRQPSFLSLYPGVITTLGFTFAANFPPRMISVEEVGAQRVPSHTHLSVLLALQRVAGNVLANRRIENLSLSAGHARSLLSCLRESFLFARKVNDAMQLRRYFQRAGWRYGMTVSSSTQLPSLLPQEVTGKQQYLHVLLSTLVQCVNGVKVAPIGEQEEARKYMVRLLQEIFQEFLAWTEVAPQYIGESNMPVDAQQRVESFTPLLVATLKELADFDKAELQHHMSWLYPLLTDLVKVSNAEVRVALSGVFSKADIRSKFLLQGDADLFRVASTFLVCPKRCIWVEQLHLCCERHYSTEAVPHNGRELFFYKK